MRVIHFAQLAAMAVAITGSLAGCASVHETYAPDGRKAYALNCSGLARGWDKCQASAGELCGSAGYDVFTRDNTGSFVMATSAGLAGGSGLERSMLVACRVPPKAAAQ